MTDLIKEERSYTIVFPEFSFKSETFYFIEFYHLNAEPMCNIQLFINGETKGENKGRYYPILIDFDYNLIGCDYDPERTTEKNCFCGEMSTLFFIGVNTRNFTLTHKLIERIYDSISLSEFISLAAGLSSTKLGVPIENLNEFSLIERIIWVANPKWAKMKNKKFKTVMSKMGKQKIDIFNNVEFIFPQTFIHHNSIARTVFANIEGIKALLPLLFQFGEIYKSPNRNSFVYILLYIN